MNILNAAGLAVYFGERELFSSVSFEIGDKDHVGLVGANGTGKTTLFKLLTGAREPDEGGFAFLSGTTVGYMEQYLASGEGKTAFEETLTVWGSLLAMEEELASLEKALAGADEAVIQRHVDLQERFEREGGLTYSSRTRSALLGLGFREEELALPVSALSGGQRAKISLAKLLLANADLLLLDEPTNHLDIDAIRWLEDYLASRSGAYLVISHDRYFLDKVTTRTFELEHGRLRAGNGGYTAYRVQKEIDDEIRRKHYELQKKEIERVEGIVAKFRQFNREKSIKQAESREKQLERLRAELIQPPGPVQTMRFTFAVRFAGPTEILNVEGLSKRYDRALYEDVHFGIRKGERAFVVGKNGCGKTTLLKQILDRRAGVTFGPGVKVGYYEQGQEGLNPSKTALDEVWDAHRSLTETEVRSALAAFLFRGEEVYKPISALSGGERARVALLKLLLSDCNLLFLDEPTNHLDLTAREALENALKDYGGTLLVVSHDRYFVNRLASRVLELSSAGLRSFDGGYDAYLAAQQPQETVREVSRSVGKGGQDWAARKERAAELRRKKGRFSRLEEEIAAVETEAASLRERLCAPEVSADYGEAVRLSQELEALTAKEEELLSEWESLGEELSATIEEE